MSENKPTSFRLSPEAVQILHDLETSLGLNRTAVVELALRRLHRSERKADAEAGRRQAKEGGAE